MEHGKRTALLAAALFLAFVLLGGCSSGADETPGDAAPANPATDAPVAKEEDRMEADRIVVTVEGREFAATLADTEAARSFAALLPLNLSMEELNGNEKYAYLDNPLPADSRNPGTIRAGDVMLFGSSCVVLFYQTFPTQYTYTPLAHLDDAEGLADVVGSGDVEAHIAFAQK